MACYLDDLGPEAIWLLKHLQLAPPRQISDVYWRVTDVMRNDVPHLSPRNTLREAGLLMRETELGALPVLDGQRLIGVLPRDLLADRYLALLDVTLRVERDLATARQALNGVVLAGRPDAQLRGQVWVGTFSPKEARRCIQPGDVVIVEDDSELQRATIEAGAGCVIVARNAPVAQEIIELAQAHGTVLLRTPRSSLAAAALLEQSGAVEHFMEHDSVTVNPNDLLNEAQQHLRQNRLASIPVIDDNGTYQGLLLRRVLVPQDRRRVILTDHNHSSQAAAGVAESEIIAIIDHHNLGGLRTLQPLSMQIEAVGCSCTLIAEAYRRSGITPSPQIAGAMLGAILSDTVQFRSPTTTPRDREMAAWLAELSEQEIENLAHQLFRARLPNPVPPPDWWVSRDWKAYTFGNTSIGIAQMELVDVEERMPPLEELRTALRFQTHREGLTTSLLLLTDILDQFSLLIAADQAGEQIAERAFGRRFAEGKLRLPGVMSRKKQVLPPIAAAITGAARM
ncbi:MAG: putative manganese-dependent inorganic diphosphatase [Roseiflexaceae bacterium]|nr:putative manganese-dependent inorganic diphosphatase [Roseiflexaceae bacterium]